MRTMLRSILIECILLVIGFHQPGCALRLLKLDVPAITDYRDAATLSCTFDLAGNALNSVKWYKDGHEFYRYAPAMSPTVRQFAVAGVHLATDQLPTVCNTHVCSIRLSELRAPHSNGAYRCEISGDAPEFKLAHRTSNLTVAALPRHDPDIGGLAASYSYGSRVVANCTTDRSSPAATIAWFINNVPLSPAHLLAPSDLGGVEIVDAYAVRSRTQEASFTVDRTEWGDTEQLYVKCVATIEGYPQLTRERIRTVRLTSDDRLNNDRLVNVKSGGSSPAAGRMEFDLIVALTAAGSMAALHLLGHDRR